MTSVLLWFGAVIVSYLAGWITGPYVGRKLIALKDRVLK